MALRIAVLCSDDAHHRYLVGLLSTKFHVAAVVVEPGSWQRRRRLQQRRFVDFAFFVYHHARRRLLGLDQYRRSYFGPPGSPPASVPVAVIEVQDINAPEVPALLARVAPDVTVVMGTSVLRRKTLETAGGTVLNIHGGYLPYYRGNHCIFFAMYEGRLDRIGSTIHFIDPGVDTGDIVEVAVPPVCSGDTPERLYCRAEMMAIHRLVDLLLALENGEPLQRTAQAKDGRVFRMRDRGFWKEVVFWTRWLATHRRASLSPQP